jgi:hypothetical protein
MSNSRKSKPKIYTEYLTMRISPLEKEHLRSLQDEKQLKSYAQTIRYLINTNKLETNQKEQNKELVL